MCDRNETLTRCRKLLDKYFVSEIDDASVLPVLSDLDLKPVFINSFISLFDELLNRLDMNALSKKDVQTLASINRWLHPGTVEGDPLTKDSETDKTGSEGENDGASSPAQQEQSPPRSNKNPYDQLISILNEAITLSGNLRNTSKSSERKCIALQETIDQSGVGLANIDRIVMVGGSSNLRPLIERMDSLYGEKLFFPEETMWNVGQGAAKLAMTPGAYYSNQSIGIVLSDNSFFALLSPDTPLENWSTECHFGIVDTNTEARFVFGGSPDIEESPDRFKSLSVPAYRFLQEQIILRALVDKNMVFRVIAGSTMRPSEYRRVWDYSQLKCYYKLPDMQVKL